MARDVLMLQCLFCSKKTDEKKQLVGLRCFWLLYEMTGDVTI